MLEIMLNVISRLQSSPVLGFSIKNIKSQIICKQTQCRNFVSKHNQFPFFQIRRIHIIRNGKVSNVNCFTQSNGQLNLCNLKRYSTVKKYQLNIAPEETTNPIYINTNVSNNVLLYKYDKTIFFRFANVFGIIAMISLFSMSDNMYMVYFQKGFENKPLTFKEKLLKFILPGASVLIGIICGPLILFGIYFVTIRHVKYIILHKGGEVVTFLTHHPWKKATEYTLPLSQLSCKANRQEKKSYCSVRHAKTKFFFIIDKSGEFINPELFDGTVGVERDVI